MSWPGLLSVVPAVYRLIVVQEAALYRFKSSDYVSFISSWWLIEVMPRNEKSMSSSCGVSALIFEYFGSFFCFFFWFLMLVTLILTFTLIELLSALWIIACF